MDKLPVGIEPLGLGKNFFPSKWLNEKSGENISNLNSYYGEFTGIYWVWKNRLSEMSKNDLIGNCHYRKLWLNKCYSKKQNKTLSSLHSNLLQPKDLLLEKFDSIQVQPIIFKNKSLLKDFQEIHNSSILEQCVNLLDKGHKKSFLNHLNQNVLFPLNMFITKVELFEKYCETIFPWLDKCLKLCLKKNLCNNYNTRLPAFLAERFTSYWFSQYQIKLTLSYARLGNIFLSNRLNKFINPIKLPLTFRIYPTTHSY